ncbi:MAG TPA: hypothetical protein VMM93_14945 [Vicinamibacterales bacterium]|nr:hypothetical protein [Vicinamibacterales bacterium]
MTHVTVRRALVAFSTGLLVLAFVFALSVNRPAPAPAAAPADVPAVDGREAFDRHCAACHDVDYVVEYLRAAPDAEAGRRALAQLLERHGDAPTADNAAIVAFVSRQVSANTSRKGFSIRQAGWP